MLLKPRQHHFSSGLAVKPRIRKAGLNRRELFRSSSASTSSVAGLSWDLPRVLFNRPVFLSLNCKSSSSCLGAEQLEANARGSQRHFRRVNLGLMYTRRAARPHTSERCPCRHRTEAEEVSEVCVRQTRTWISTGIFWSGSEEGGSRKARSKTET